MWLYALLYWTIGWFVGWLVVWLVSCLVGQLVGLLHYGSEQPKIGTSKFTLSHELGSEWVRERANEWAQRNARAKRAVRSKQMSEWCERMSEQISAWPSLHPIVRWRKILRPMQWHNAVGIGGQFFSQFEWKWREQKSGNFMCFWYSVMNRYS